MTTELRTRPLEPGEELQVGRRYVTRDGQLTNPLRSVSLSVYPIAGRVPTSPVELSWMASGQWHREKPNHRKDIVAIVIEDEPRPPGDPPAAPPLPTGTDTHPIRVTQLHVMPRGKPTFDEQATIVEIIDEAVGEFLNVRQHKTQERPGIDIDPAEWPAIREAIDYMIGQCRRENKDSSDQYLAVRPFRIMPPGPLDARPTRVKDVNGDIVLVCYDDDEIKDDGDPCGRFYSEHAIDGDLSFVCHCGRLGLRMVECSPKRAGLEDKDDDFIGIRHGRRYRLTKDGDRWAVYVPERLQQLWTFSHHVSAADAGEYLRDAPGCVQQRETIDELTTAAREILARCEDWMISMGHGEYVERLKKALGND